MSEQSGILEVQGELPGPKIMLLGDSGSGKTHSLRTLLEVDPQIKVFCVFTEMGMDICGPLPKERFHWHYVRPFKASWASIKATALMINQLTYEGLTKASAIEKQSYKEALDVLECLSNFKCDRTGEVFGPVDDWATDRVVVLDSLTGWSLAVKYLHIGGKPTLHQGEWGVPMDHIERMFNLLTTALNCPVVIIAHTERELDETAGTSQVMASTLGKKLAPKLNRNCSDVIHCKREGSKFTWSTTTPGYALKARHVPWKDGMEPSFVPLFKQWISFGGKITPTKKPA